VKERFPLLRHRALACGIWIVLALVTVGALTTLVRAELSEEEKKKRAAFLNAREEMRTLSSPTPDQSPSAKPKAARPKKKAKATPAKTPEQEESAKPKDSDSEVKKTKDESPAPDQSPSAKPKAAKPKKKAKATPTKTPEPEESAKPKDSDSEVKKAKDEEKSPTPKKHSSRKRKKSKSSPSPTPRKKHSPAKSSPKPSASPKITPKSLEEEAPLPSPSATPSATPQPTVARAIPFAEAPQVNVEKSGFLGDQGLEPPPTPPPRRGFWPWSRVPSTYRYLSRSVRAEIDRAPVQRRRWQFIVVHNSGTRQGNARVFDYYHRHVRRMQNGLAYQFVIGNGTSTGNGQIEVGDRWRRQINGGHVHSDYLNNIALGICLVGDFNRDQPTRAQLDACEELIRYLRKRCGKIDAHYAIVRPHREVNPPRWATDCPGDDFPYSWFRRFQE
jgi:hypothetical protein